VHRDWDAVFDLVDHVQHTAIPPEAPDVNLDAAFHCVTEGVPRAGQSECSYAAVSWWNLYDNHKPLLAILDMV